MEHKIIIKKNNYFQSNSPVSETSKFDFVNLIEDSLTLAKYLVKYVNKSVIKS